MSASAPHPRLTRRRFVTAAGAAAALAALPAPAFGARRRPRRWRNRLSYEGLRGGFGIRVPGELAHRPLTLDAVADVAGTTRRGKPLAGRADAFVLTFAAAWGPALEQGTYELRHRVLGPTRLFLVPGGTRRGRQLYVAVINHAV